MKIILKKWLPFAVTISAFCLLIYASVQQSYRQDANDPQIQMANDAADALNSGASIASVLPQGKVYFDKSLVPFLLIYDMSGKPVAGSGYLNGALPEIPKGVLDTARGNGENRRTWQPSGEVRVASVVVPYNDGYVVAGRNIREVEIREQQSQFFAGLTWVLGLISTWFVIWFGEIFLRDKN